MSWLDDLLEARYTAPSGKSMAFGWQDAPRETELKTGTFTFPDVDGADVQHLGYGARTFAMDCVFHGASCVEEGEQFEALLVERGKGVLQHPVYGEMAVVPTGAVKTQNKIAEEANVTIVSVTFTQTIGGKEFKERRKDIGAAEAQGDAANAAMADSYGRGLEEGGEGEKARREGDTRKTAGTLGRWSGDMTQGTSVYGDEQAAQAELDGRVSG